VCRARASLRYASALAWGRCFPTNLSVSLRLPCRRRAGGWCLAWEYGPDLTVIWHVRTLQGQPSVLGQGAQEFKGQDAKLSIIVGAMAVADLVKSTLGPKGMDKILQSQSGDITVTNDGATILKKLTLDNPAAKILVDISKTQDEEVGDGTTTVCILAGALLEQADPLLSQRLHPQTIIEGWRLALQVARKTLESMAWDIQENPAEFRKYLFKIAKTTLSSKIVHVEHDLFAEMCVDAVLRLKGSGNLENICIIKRQGGSMRDSFHAEGFILDKKIGVGQAKVLENCKVLIANTPMDTDKVNPEPEP
jgi:T-complex protein 1 subunit beta